MVDILDVKKVDFPLNESSTLFWVSVRSAEDLMKAAEFEGVAVVYRCEDRLYFVKGCMGVKFAP